MATEMKIAKILAGITAELVDAVGDRDMFRDWCIKRGKEIEALKVENAGLTEEAARMETENARLREELQEALDEESSRMCFREIFRLKDYINDLQAEYAELAALVRETLDGMSDDDNPFMRAGQVWADLPVEFGELPYKIVQIVNQGGLVRLKALFSAYKADRLDKINDNDRERFEADIRALYASITESANE